MTSPPPSDDGQHARNAVDAQRTESDLQAVPIGAPIRNVFADIHAGNYWGNEDSQSGYGSDLTQTAAVREALPGLLAALGVRRVLDIPCGDLFWISRCSLDLDEYIGADIVPDLVDEVRRRYGSAQRQFRCLDLTSDSLPQADLVLCRDALVHLSFADIAKAIANLKASGSTYLLTTTFTGRESNIDIPTGHWRPLNLERPPFSFPPPMRLIDERCTEHFGKFADKSLGLWRLAELPELANLPHVPARAAVPRVTVITPTYNRARYLPETIESVLAQNYPNLEYLVIDDGSTDDTEAVVRRYVESHPGVVTYLHHPNCGEAATVNRGWKLATGEYVAIVSSDDPQPPHWLQSCVSWMERNPLAIVGYPDWTLIDDEGRLLEDQRVPDYNYMQMLVDCVCLPGPGALIRRHAVRVADLRNPGFRYASDYETWLRLGLQGEFMRIPVVAARWRKHPGSLTVGNTLDRAEEYVRAVASLFNQPDLPAPLRAWRARAIINAVLLGFRIVAGGDNKWAVRRFIFRAMLKTRGVWTIREIVRLVLKPDTLEKLKPYVIAVETMIVRWRSALGERARRQMDRLS
jgi:glycosyltransferase involved in cell wall biosynthesis